MYLFKTKLEQEQETGFGNIYTPIFYWTFEGFSAKFYYQTENYVVLGFFIWFN